MQHQIELKACMPENYFFFFTYKKIYTFFFLLNTRKMEAYFIIISDLIVMKICTPYIVRDLYKRISYKIISTKNNFMYFTVHDFFMLVCCWLVSWALCVDFSTKFVIQQEDSCFVWCIPHLADIRDCHVQVFHIRILYFCVFTCVSPFHACLLYL